MASGVITFFQDQTGNGNSPEFVLNGNNIVIEISGTVGSAVIKPEYNIGDGTFLPLLLDATTQQTFTSVGLVTADFLRPGMSIRMNISSAAGTDLTIKGRL